MWFWGNRRYGSVRFRNVQKGLPAGALVCASLMFVAFQWDGLVLASHQPRLDDVEKARFLFQKLKKEKAKFEELERSDEKALFWSEKELRAHIEQLQFLTRLFTHNDQARDLVTDDDDARIRESVPEIESWYRVVLKKGNRKSIALESLRWLHYFYQHPNVSNRLRKEVNENIERELKISWEGLHPQNRAMDDNAAFFKDLYLYQYSNAVLPYIKRLAFYYLANGDCRSLVSLLYMTDQGYRWTSKDQKLATSLLVCALAQKRVGLWVIGKLERQYLEAFYRDFSKKKEFQKWIAKNEKTTIDVFSDESDPSADLVGRLIKRAVRRYHLNQQPKRNYPWGRFEANEKHYQLENSWSFQGSRAYGLVSEIASQEDSAREIYLAIYDTRRDQLDRLIYLGRYASARSLVFHFQDPRIVIFDVQAHFVRYESRNSYEPSLHFEVSHRVFNRFGNRLNPNLINASEVITKRHEAILYPAAIEEVFRSLQINIFTHASSEISRFGRSTIPFLVEEIQSKSSIRRGFALIAYAEQMRRSPGKAGFVIDYLFDRSLFVRNKAVEALAQFDSIPKRYQKKIDQAFDFSHAHWQEVDPVTVSEENASPHLSAELSVQSVQATFAYYEDKIYYLLSL